MHGLSPDRSRAREPELVLGRYVLGARLGTGGFGTVWRARDTRLDREVAVKRIGVEDPSVAQRAAREAKAAARLSHPAIVALHEAGRDEGAVWLVSELVRGRTLGELMAAGALSDRDVLAVGEALCGGLAHAHGRGVVHRDVKPGNVLVPDLVDAVTEDEDGWEAEPGEEERWEADRPPVAPDPRGAKLCDFGIAMLLGEDVLTRTGDVVGTLAYMAPEQAEGREVTKAADLYALALVLYEALSGVNPIRGRTPASTVRRVGVRLPALHRVRRDLPRGLCDAIDRAVLPRPEDRGTLGALRGALKAGRGEVDDAPGSVEASRVEGLTRQTRMAVRAHRGRAPHDPGPWGDEDEDPTPTAARGRPAGPSARLAAALGTGGLTTAALAGLGPPAPVLPLAAGVLAAAAAGLLPRLGALAAALAVVGWLLTADGTLAHDGLVVVLVAAVLPVAALLRGTSGAWWPAPALAPVLGLLGLAGAAPGVLGQARRWPERAALGALGAWWLELAEVARHQRLLLGPPPAATPRAAWEPSAAAALQHALAPLATSGALALAAVWALGAVLLGGLVRGRHLAPDLVAAAGVSAGLAAATAALGRALPGAPEPHGLVAGAILGGVLVVAGRAWRGP